MTGAACQSRQPERPWGYRDEAPTPDRCYWHPCGKGHVGQCRGQAVIRTRNWRTVDFLQWVGPPYALDTAHRLWTTERMAKSPHRCADD